MKIGFVVKHPLQPGTYMVEADPVSNVGIERVIFNDPATIILWKDGTKTVVKCANEPYDPEKGLAMALVKKSFGNSGSYYKIFKKWLSDDKPEETPFDKLNTAMEKLAQAFRFLPKETADEPKE